jgi:hypothetical protein
LKNIIPFYLITLIIREVGQFSTLKAFLCWFIPTAVYGMFILGMFFISTQITQMQSTGFGADKIEGFPVIKPLNYKVDSNGTDNAVILLPMLNQGEVATLEKAEIKVFKNGTYCRLENAGIFSFADIFNNKTRPENITLKPSGGYYFATNLLTLSISGPGCGGEFFEDYKYYIEMKIHRGGGVVDNSGSISGEYQ